MLRDTFDKWCTIFSSISMTRLNVVEFNKLSFREIVCHQSTFVPLEEGENFVPLRGFHRIFQRL